MKRNYLQQKELLSKDKRVLINHKGGQLSIKVVQIAIIAQVYQVNWMVMRSGESYILNLSLKEINALLSGYDFFQVNRKQIVNKEVIKKITARSFGKLELTLHVHYENQVTVSKDRAKRFKEWLAKD
ncbi:LytTR family DNA-binding domain-containing protein [Pedobacter sp. KR3-3]|uniref:LytTR family DNA-binding domain-containing protein n=1 Tax=Pedobacter albus TaxID=3113905 RepID=A0ABU7I3L2_9SPHI|nr:LytTR family DNA-binding domain-containing protein [Pedobacter sp. KR3-3]MEE1943854.1 LytTR family DNA-binding domain-containing protein [Pedobacter sp. KR3-3]